MKRLFYITLTSILFLQSCSTTKPDLTNISGTYYGKLPCADCPGINYQLTLNSDSTYEERMVYLEKSTAPVLEKGHFELNKKNQVVLAHKSEDFKTYFSVDSSKLKMLDITGKAFKTDLADSYVLTKEKPSQPTGMPILQATFRASGSNPYWGMELWKNKELHFYYSDPNNQQFKFESFTYKPLKDGFGGIYEANSDQGHIKATITKQKCTVDGKENDFCVNAIFTPKDGTAKTFDGCGFFLADYRLFDIWALESINGKPIDKSAFERGVPTMEINLTTNRVSGLAGCNQYSGSIELGQSVITFSQMLSTKMACSNLDTEQQFMQAISDASLNYTLDKGILTLKNGSTVLVFKKVD